MRWLRLGGRVLLWILCGGGLAVFISVVAVPKFNGWIPLTVLSGSMEPTYPVGSQVVVERVGPKDADDLEVGDVITFLPRPEDTSVVTHRIVRKAHRPDGIPVFTTRGDANNSDDQLQLTDQQIRGKDKSTQTKSGCGDQALTQQKKHRRR